MKKKIILYLWPFSLFKDCSVGNNRDQLIAYKHNKENGYFLIAPFFNWISVIFLSMFFLNLVGKPDKSNIVLSNALSLVFAATFIAGILISLFIFFSYIVLTKSKE